ncbi:MAG: hypothetical protein ACXWKC_19485 [Xanthobacteraceae bacterium]
MNRASLAVGSTTAAHRLDALDLPSTAELLTSGGDPRIVCDATSGQNKYGCSAKPEPDVLAFGSSTASTITSHGFDAAERLRVRLLHAARAEIPSTTYAHELARIRGELLELYGLSDLPGLAAIFAASGTDIHLIAGQLAGDAASSGSLVVMIDPAETGTGVPAALAGQHFSDRAALGSSVMPGTTIFGASAPDVAAVACRGADGAPRAAAVVDAEVEALVVDAITAGRRVLLNLVDVSKTGIIAPSLSCALELRRRFPAAIDVLVDSCQFRLAPSTLRAYLERGFWVALTGSKFVGGPAFSGVLLLPDTVSQRLRTHILSPALNAYSARADWPPGWMARHSLNDTENYGLLLRWEAALAETRRFCSLLESAVAGFLDDFAANVQRRLTTDSTFRLLPVPKLDRRALVSLSSWDEITTIFPFVLCHPAGSERHGTPLSRQETSRIHKLLARDETGRSDACSSPAMRTVAARRCQLGQPVECGTFCDVPVSALRLCASMRLIVDAVSPEGRGAKMVIGEALATLDKAALLAASI